MTQQTLQLNNVAYLQNDDVQRVIIKHTAIARDIRIDIANILCTELIGTTPYAIKDIDTFRAKYSIFAHFLIAIQVVPAWIKFKKTLKKIPEFVSMCLAEMLESIFTLMEETSAHTDADLARINISLQNHITQFIRIAETFLADPLITKTIESLNPRGENDSMQSLFDTTAFDNCHNTRHSPAESLNRAKKILLHVINNSPFADWFYSLSEEQRSVLLSFLLSALIIIKRVDAFYGKYIAQHAEMFDKIHGLYCQAFGDKQAGQLRKKLLLSIHDIADAFGSMEEFERFLNLLGRITFGTGIRSTSVQEVAASDIYSIAHSSEISRIIPSELQKLSHPLRKYLFYAELAEQRLMSYELKSIAPEALSRRGPAVVVVDTSGSMSGLPENVAKAFTFSLITTLARENRSVHLILFSSEDEQIEFSFNPAKSNPDSVLTFLQYSFDGGTDFDAAIRKALPRFHDEAFKNADLTFITDGGDTLSGDVSEEIALYKKNFGIRVYCILIDGDNAGLQKIADMTARVNKDGTWEQDSSPSNILNAGIS